MTGTLKGTLSIIGASMPAAIETTDQAVRTERRRGIAICLVAVVALGIQFADLSLVMRESDTAESVVDTHIALAPGATESVLEVKLLWRDFRPGERLSAAPAGWICAASLQRGEERATLVVRLCVEQPVSAERRYGLGYDSFVLSALLPGGQHLSYSLVNFRATGRWSAADFNEGPTHENSAPIRRVFVRDATDIVVVFESDLAVGLPTISVRGALGGRSFSDAQTFEPLGPSSEIAQLESRHSEAAPLWAKQRP
jgi:hypothetical protein